MDYAETYDEDLNPVLIKASDEELDPLVEYIKKKTSQMLTTRESYETFYPRHSIYNDWIAKELRDMGGNSFANLFRGFKGPSYHEVVCDVAEKVKAPYQESSNIEDIESAILEMILKKALDEMDDSQKRELLREMGGKADIEVASLASTSFIALFRAGGFYSYQLTVIIANQIARVILGRGLMFATNAMLTKTASLIFGPFSLAISGIWTVYDIAGPAYSVTIPCVVHVAMLRRKQDSTFEIY